MALNKSLWKTMENFWWTGEAVMNILNNLNLLWITWKVWSHRKGLNWATFKATKRIACNFLKLILWFMVMKTLLRSINITPVRRLFSNHFNVLLLKLCGMILKPQLIFLWNLTCGQKTICLMKFGYYRRLFLKEK